MNGENNFMKIKNSLELDNLRKKLKPLSNIMADKGVFKSDTGMKFFRIFISLSI